MKPIIQTQLAAEGENSAIVAELIAEAEVEVNPPYRELRIGVKNEADKYVADILIGLNSTGELRVLLTTDGEGDGDHEIAVFPLRPLQEAIEKE